MSSDQCSTTQGDPTLSLWLFQQEKKIDGETPAPPSHPTPPHHPGLWVALPEPLLWSLPMGIAGEFVRLNHWETDSDRKRKGSCNNQHLTLGRPSLHLQHPNYCHGVTFLEYRTTLVAYSDPEAWQGADLLDSESHMRVFASPIAQFPHAQARKWVIVPFAVEEVFWLHLTRRTGENIWKQCSTAVLKPKGKWAKLIVPRAKPVLGIKFPVLNTGRGLNSHLRLTVVPKPSQRNCLGNWELPRTAPLLPNEARVRLNYPYPL